MKSKASLRAFLFCSTLLAGQSAHAATYTWANSNVAGAQPASLNWFAATQGTWTGGTPVSNNLNTIQFFQDATTQLTNTGGTQASVIDNGGSAFQLGALTLSGRGGTTSAVDLAMTISGDALNFSAATGTINLNAVNGSRVLSYNVNSAIQLGTASSASALTLTGNGNAVFSIGGVISELQVGGGSLTKSGTSTVRLSGANTYTGTTTISGGTLQLGNAGTTGSLSTSSAIVVNSGTFTIARSNAVTQGTDFSGAAITGAGGFTQSGGTTGTTTLNAANTYTGVTTISGGVLAFATAADGGLPSNLGQSSSDAANLVIGGTSTTALRYTGTGGSTDRLFTINNVTYVCMLDASGTGAINFTNPGAIAYGTNNAVRTLQLMGSNTGNNTLAALIQDNGTGKVSINKAWDGGAGTWVITGNNSYTGDTEIGDGTLVVTSLKNIGTNSNLGAGGTIKFGRFNPAGTLRYEGTATETNRAIDFSASGGNSVMTIDQSGTGLLKFTGTFTSTGGGTAKIVQLRGSTAGTGEMASALVDNSPTNKVGITKSGTGTWTLSGSNTNTGISTVNAGTLKLAYGTTDTSKLSDTAVLNLNGGTLELSGGTHTEVVVSTTLNTGGTFIKQTNSGTAKLAMGAITFTGGAIDFGADSIATTTTGNDASGILANTVGIGRITVAGADFAKNDGSNNIVAYTGYTPGYAGGVMAASTNYSMTAGTSITTSRGATSNTLKIDPTAGQSIAISTGQTLTLGTILFTGANDFAINTTGTGKVVTTLLHNYGTGGAVLNLGALGGALVQYGTGKTVLTSAAQANAGVTVNGGSVQFSTNAQLGSVSNGATLVLNNGTLVANTAGGNITLDNSGANKRLVTLNAGGGTLDVIGGGKLTVSGVISGTGNPLTIGGASTSGTVELTGINTYTGATTISGGTLAVTGSLGATAVSVANTATLSGNGNIGGSVTIASGATHSLAVAATTGAQLTRAITGTLTLTAGNILNLTAAATPAAGVYVLATATTAITGTPTTINYNGITGTVSVDTASSPKRLLLTVTGGSAYDTWKAAYAPGSNPGDDTDGDGVSNAVEFVLGGTSATKDLDKLPVPDASGSNLTFIFERAQSSIDPKTAVFIETSTDLVTWNTPPSPYTVPDGVTAGPPVTVVKGVPANFDTVTLTVTKAPDAKKFARLKVVITP